MRILYQTESFLTACFSLVDEPDKPWLKQEPSCTNSRKKLRRNCSPIGHNNTKHFLCPIRSRHPLEFLEIARWESVPRGSFAHTWKLSSRLFSRPDWLPLGLQRWPGRWTHYYYSVLCRNAAQILTIILPLKSRKTRSKEDQFFQCPVTRTVWMWP